MTYKIKYRGVTVICDEYATGSNYTVKANKTISDTERFTTLTDARTYIDKCAALLKQPAPLKKSKAVKVFTACWDGDTRNGTTAFKQLPSTDGTAYAVDFGGYKGTKVRSSELFADTPENRKRVKLIKESYLAKEKAVDALQKKIDALEEKHDKRFAVLRRGFDVAKP